MSLATTGPGEHKAPVDDPGRAMLIGARGSRPSRWLLVAAAVMVLVSACGGTTGALAGAPSAFPDTPAGKQARWFLQAVRSEPIPDAAIRAHFAPATLEQLSPAAINARLAGAGQVGLVSVAGGRSDTVGLVVSIRGAQRFRIGVTVNSQGLIDDLSTQEVRSTATPASMIPALPSRWVAEPVTFVAQGVTIHGTYTHPRRPLPAGSRRPSCSEVSDPRPTATTTPRGSRTATRWPRWPAGWPPVGWRACATTSWAAGRRDGTDTPRCTSRSAPTSTSRRPLRH